MDAGGTTTKTGIYCRGCDYDLRASDLRCPECGRAFDAANPKTYFTSPRSRRVRWWARQIVLLILLVTLPPALGLGWLVWGWRTEQGHLAALKEAGWRVGPSIPMYPWLPRFLPVRWGFLADRVIGVGNPLLARGPASPPLPREAVRHIANLTCLRGLTIAQTLPTDQDVHELRGLSRLERIHLTGPGITDRALADLAGMKSMHAIILRDTSIAGPGLRHLATLPRLKSLELIGGAIGDEALTSIGEMKQIQELWLKGVPITDEGMKRLAGLTQLRVLSLEGMKIG